MPYLETGHSWEEWATVEGFLELHAAGLSVSPRPNYSNVPRRLGDYLIGIAPPEEALRGQLMVELKFIHDSTKVNAAAAIDEDSPKIEQERAIGRPVLVIIALVALDRTREWTHLPNLGVWSRPTPLRRSGSLGNRGSVEIRGWFMPPS